VRRSDLRASRSRRASRSATAVVAAPVVEAAAAGWAGCAWLIFHGTSHMGLTFPGLRTGVDPNRDMALVRSFLGDFQSG
jgi:hypothetical protein